MSESAGSARALCRFYVPGHGARLGGIFDGRVVDLTAREPALFGSLSALLASGGSLDDALERHAGAEPSYGYAELDREPAPDAAHLLAPIDAQEVWAAGVTYTRSRQARMEESRASADVYARVYDAERPELFFKATPGRVVGPHAPVAVRSDAAWSVPEPELVVLLDPTLTIVGFTVGNDLTARDIEAQNPLYLPQAKVFDGGCALGPHVVPAGRIDPLALEITCSILRDGRELFAASTNTRALHRPLDDLVAYLGRHNRFPSGVWLMTGTGIVPPDDVALRPGDTIAITVEGIGTLQNTVVSGE